MATYHTFVPSEGLKQWAAAVVIMIANLLSAQGMTPSPTAKDLARKLLVADCNYKQLYRAYAIELHPDKGGTNADMALLNDAYARRKKRGCRKDNNESRVKAKTYMRAKPKTQTRAKKSSEQNKNASEQNASDVHSWSFDTGKFVAGVCAGGALAATARECRKIKKREQDGEPHRRALRVPSAR